MEMQKRVWMFEEGNRDMRDLLGGKGANLAEMTNIGLAVPPGFTITTEVCNEFVRLGNQLPAGLTDEIHAALAKVEAKIGKKFGDPTNPLLVSVRSGAKFSMPGMMDTVLNLGLNDQTAEGLLALTHNERFVWDAYRRFIMMFGDVVMDVDKKSFEAIFGALKHKLGVKLDTEVDSAHLKTLCAQFKAHYRKRKGHAFPEDPLVQLQYSVEAVFRSWNNPRAITYRRTEKIPDDLGTAVNVQCMVFGNMGTDSGTGVAFTRNPANGEKGLYGEYLMNAQGEDVVAGVRTPVPISQLAKQDPTIYKQFEKACRILEDHYREMQDIEFTIERGRLFILQCRTGKRTGPAAVKIAVDMVKEKRITRAEALLRLPPEQLEQCLHPRLKVNGKPSVFVKGMNAGPGGAVGRIVLDSHTAARLGKGGRGEKIILVREETNPDDIDGMLAAQGVLTARGGRTSHAALVARQFGIPTICGAGDMHVDEEGRRVRSNGFQLKEGDWISLDGTAGVVYIGQMQTEPSAISDEFKTFMAWADAVRRLGVRANADTPEQAAQAVEFGAQGIGLCRTEHMFLEPSRLPIVRQMILAETDKIRQVALDKLEPMQRGDFYGIFKAMGGRPVTIRLIDPPLHEFLPRHDELLEAVTRLRLTNPGSSTLKRKEHLLSKVREMQEANPMLGLRGCRLSIVFPQIVQMQVGAIIGAACDCARDGIKTDVEIMIPLVGHVNELRVIKQKLDAVARESMKRAGRKVKYSFGTMIEVPRAALTADEIAQEASFFSFGTNDLTQMTYAISRDDAGKFIGKYVEDKIIPGDPTESIDRAGVGKLMDMCVKLGRGVSPKLKIGICGEHGGDPRSVKFCHSIGLDYVSCSPRRLPIARLAAAQAVLEESEAKDVRDK
ncbi:MAG: pyruvate, phosphate dikinase [Acidobacteria bacterium]|nr:pyruvate, phosphate dikinase [Acidobacteriota bacterium]MBI3656029.1 pyruvate, phosphate dikinase [Acidobacteriota bacterium]